MRLPGGIGASLASLMASRVSREAMNRPVRGEAGRFAAARGSLDAKPRRAVPTATSLRRIRATVFGQGEPWRIASTTWSMSNPSGARAPGRREKRADLERLGQHVVLRAEVSVDGSVVHAGAKGDVADRYRCEAVLGEELDRSGQ